MKVTMLRWKLFWRKRGKVGNDTFFYMIFCLNMLVCFSAEMCQYSCLDNGVCEVLYTGPPRYVRKCIARDYKGWLVSRPIWVSPKGRDAIPNRMNFRKKSKQPLTLPPLFFSGNYIAILLPKTSEESLIYRSKIWFLDWKWPPPPLELSRKFIRFGSVTCPLPLSNCSKNQQLFHRYQWYDP